MTRCVVFFSGGAGSWASAKRAVATYGAANTILLFTDVQDEDEDLYRFLREAAPNVGAELVCIAEGRGVWQVFNDKKFIGNSMKDPCSEILKRKLALLWLRQNCDPADTVLVFGIGWEESERFDDGQGHGIGPRYARQGWKRSEAPLLAQPWMTRDDIWAWMRLEGLRRPRMYDEGFPHNNCRGACVKAGEGQWELLLRVRPAVFAEWEAEEAAFNARRPDQPRQTILAPKRQIGNARERFPISLREFREHVQSGGEVDLFDWGGCDCFAGASHEVDL